LKNNNCAICGKNFQDVKDSNEHIIPNALGGRKKIKGFICVDCNNYNAPTKKLKNF